MIDSQSQDNLPDPIPAVESEIDESEATNDTPVEALTDKNRNDGFRSEEHTSELQSRRNLVCRLLLEKKKKITTKIYNDTD